MWDLSGRTALITGASRGIGAAIAREYAAHGMRVAVNYRQDAAAARRVADSLDGSGHVIIEADVSDPAETKRLVDQAAGELGRLDVLVNNAAIYEFQPFDMEDYDAWRAAWDRTMDLNLAAAVNATFCALRHMRAQGGGRVISIGSRGGFRGETEAPAYAASKMALVGFTRSLARATARQGIYAFCIAPGWVDTDMSRPRMADRLEAIEAEIPAGRIAAPADVAGVALFLASDAADYLTGVTIDVNGGSYFR